MTPSELQALFLRGAEAGARTLVALLEQGTSSGAIKPRDLAVVTGIMVDKVAKLAPLAKKEDELPTSRELEEAEEEAEALLAEKRRRREAVALEGGQHDKGGRPTSGGSGATLETAALPGEATPATTATSSPGAPAVARADSPASPPRAVSAVPLPARSAPAGRPDLFRPVSVRH